MHGHPTTADRRTDAAPDGWLVAATGPSAAAPSAPTVAWPIPLPTWRVAFDLLWAAVEGERSGARAREWSGSGGSPGSRVAPGGSTQHRDRDEVARARIEALVQLAQEGDREAFAQLYDSYVDTVFRYVLVRVGQRPLAEDLTSETFIRAMRRIDTFSWQGRDIAAWFVTIARNLIADHVKSARFRFEVTTADMRDADDLVDAPETEVLARLRDERLVAAIRQLAPEQAECITLRFLQGLNLAQTAAVLGKSEGAVKQLQLRATRALRRLLEGVEL
ncbi:sigma-70 family RNA polymerase sigma factor [Intrasporangium sp.]|uniref:RNA polymerase sigma factor n=1 Tax=Intrasporangium sp. TaxID=1925024 RepID=UPI00293B23B4|nr:sigma-70 family RNA polymerase sigma factor [Intrasporangium sp.]MDV3220753.1 sigma-70 family RNA polymerase sigma factor [Intrasporangium sp.]